MSAGEFKPLVLGAAVGYSRQQVKPFLFSLRQSGYQGAVVLLTSAALARAVPADELFAGVECIATPQWLPLRFTWGQSHLRTALRLWRPLQALLWLAMRMARGLPKKLRFAAQAAVAQALLPPTESRYLHYLRYLRGHDYSHILLSDVRDVVFQSNPFPSLPNQGLAVSMEQGYSVAGEPHNAEWVRQAAGEKALAAIGRQPVSCSGVSYGERTALLHYLEKMAERLFGLGRRATERSGIDQGIHNYLLHTGQLGVPQRLNTLASAVATVHGVGSEELHCNAQGQLLNRDGSVVSVVHQYDRHPALMACLMAQHAA